MVKELASLGADINATDNRGSGLREGREALYEREEIGSEGCGGYCLSVFSGLNPDQMQAPGAS